VSRYPVLKSRKLELVFNIPISKTQPFWEGLKDGKVYATKCKGCGRLYFPPAADCGDCLKSDVEWIELTGTGRVLAYTHVNVRPQSFQNEEPYTVGVAEFEAGARVLAWIVGGRPEEVHIGMQVRLVTKTLQDGRVMYVLERVSG